MDEGEVNELIVIFPETAQPVALPLEPAASGSQYNDSDLMVWIQGEEALVDRDGESLYTGCIVNE